MLWLFNFFPLKGPLPSFQSTNRPQHGQMHRIVSQLSHQQAGRAVTCAQMTGSPTSVSDRLSLNPDVFPFHFSPTDEPASLGRNVSLPLLQTLWAVNLYARPSPTSSDVMLESWCFASAYTKDCKIKTTMKMKPGAINSQVKLGLFLKKKESSLGLW